MNELLATPQVFIIGTIKDAENFESKRLYAKYEFKFGENWKLLNGHKTGESFDCISVDQHTPLEQPFELQFVCKSIRGWPRMLVEVWEVDEHQRNKIAGYGVLNIPFRNGFYKLDIMCWRPKASFFDKMIGSHPELQYPDLLVSSQQRDKLVARSTGKVRVEFSVVLKDFNLHGMKM